MDATAIRKLRLTGRAHYAVALIAFVFALLSKPSAVTVPLLAFVLDVLILRRRVARSVAALIPWLILSALCTVVAALAQPAIGVTPAPLWARHLIALDSLAFYLYKLVWPMNLGIDYGRRPQIVIARGWIWFTWLLPVAVAVLLIVMRRRPVRPFVAAALIFVLAPLPTLGLTTFLFQYYSTTADHYLYLAMLGPALALAWALAILRARLVHVAAVIGLALLGLRTYLQTATWHDSVALFTHAIAVNPDSFLSHNNLGQLYLSSDPPQLALAEQEFLAAHQIKPDYTPALDNLAQVTYREGRPDDAIDWYEQYLKLMSQQPPELRRDLWQGHLHVARLLMDRHRYDAAYDHYQQALSLNPGNAEAKRGMEQAWRAMHAGRGGVTR